MARVNISPSTSNNSYKNVLCKEFCDGTVAVCYCPQCSAIFCDDCYNKEHQSERKMNHEKVFDVRPICEEHRHTLEYFDITLYRPLCIMCLAKFQMEKELHFHEIKNISNISSRLYSILDEKIREAQNVIKNVEDGVKQLRETTKNTIKTAKDEIHNLVEHFRSLLEERERDVMEELDKLEREHLKKDETTGLLALKRRLEDTISQASHLIQLQQHSTIGYEFPHCFNKLNDLCSVALKEIQSKDQLSITVNVSTSTLRGLTTMCKVVPCEKTQDVCDSDSKDVITSNGNVKVKVVDDLTNHTPITMETNQQTGLLGNDDESDDVNVENCDSTVTPIGDGDFYDNEDVQFDVMETMTTDSNTVIHRDNEMPSESHIARDANTSTPLTSMSAGSVRQGRRVKLKEMAERDCGTKAKRGRPHKRKVKSLPIKDYEMDTEWSPVSKRVLRSSTYEKVKKARTRRSGALIKEMDKCDSILTMLWADEDSWPFVRLVDRKKCPEYYEKIHNPLSLELVKEKLHSYKYRSVLDFVRDINNIIDNCHIFNEPGSEVQEAGKRLSSRFQQLLAETFPNFQNVFQDKELMESSL